jgi:hypothetical protein
MRVVLPEPTSPLIRQNGASFAMLYSSIVRALRCGAARKRNAGSGFKEKGFSFNP